MGKLKEFCERHSVLVTYAGIACVTLVTGAIYYKIGVNHGYSKGMREEFNEAFKAASELKGGDFYHWTEPC